MDTTHKTSEQAKASGAGSTGYGVKEAKNIEPDFGTEKGFVEKTTQLADQAKTAVSQAYDEASKTLNRTYEHAKDYSREAAEGLNRTYEQAKEYGRQKPVNAALIVFGAGFGLGLLFAGALSRPRSGNRRFVRPVINALTDIAAEIF